MGHSGFPDLVLARDGRVMFFELKREDGKTTPGQDAWLSALGPDTYVIRPSRLDAALRLLE